MAKKLSLVLMALFYIAAGVNHFRVPDFYVRIMPTYLPAHELLVYVSGIVEVVLGLGLLVPAVRTWAAWGVIGLLILFLPVHVHMLVHHELYPEAPVWFLWFRFPLQVLFALWAYWHTRR